MSSLRFHGLRVAVYARYSSSLQREASIEDQVRRCHAFIQEHGGAVNDALIFTDAATSGASLQRPGFEKMMAIVSAKPRGVDVVVTEDLTRVSRDFADSAGLFRRLQYLGVPLIGIADGVDTSSAGAKV